MHVSEDERREQRDRYRELLEELRMMIPGVQVLFAFLTVPFSARFSEIDALGKIVFAVSLVAVAIATVLFVAPATYHRLSDRHDRRGRLRYGVKTKLTGLALLGLSISCAMFVVVRFLFDSTALGVLLAVFQPGSRLWFGSSCLFSTNCGIVKNRSR